MTRNEDAGPNEIELEREIGERGDLVEFVELAWERVEPNTPFVNGWHIGAQCEHFQAIEAGEIKNLVVNIPPGCSKSRISGLYWPVWAWIRDPSLRFGHFSFDDTNTLQQNLDSLTLMNTPWFQERWGHLWTFPSRDPAIGSYFNSQGGWRFSSSVEGKATGKHFHRQVIDDPLKPKGISKVTLDATKIWLANTMSMRWVRGKKHTARALIMQRLHEDDTTAQMLATNADCVHLMLPMEFESARKCITYHKDGSVRFEDPRTDEGELLCPDWYDAEAVALGKIELTAQGASAQFQQSPVGFGGNIFKDEHFRFWIQPDPETRLLPLTARFDQAVPPRLWKVLPPKFSLQWQSWDFTFKDTKTSDYVVGQIWARYLADFYLLWQVRDRMDFTRSLKEIKALTVRFPKARKKLVEDKANGTAVMNALKGRMFGLHPVEPDGGKEARASAVAPIYESGNVYWPDPDMPGFEWVRAAMKEHTSFPFAKFDDTVDCGSQALNYGSAGFTKFAAAMDKLNGNSPRAAHLRGLMARLAGR